MPDTTIVIPCYNEAARLDIDRFVRHAMENPSHSFVLVNDGSTDATLEVLNDLKSAAPEQFEVLDLAQNSGKAEAVRRGVLAALLQSPKSVGYWDADLATPLDAIDTFRQLLDQRPELELAMGARIRLLGRDIQRKRNRHMLGRIFATFASTTLGLGVYDTQCGAKMFRVGEGTRELFNLPFVTNWIFDVELLARLICRRRNGGEPPVEDAVYEIPLAEWRDVAGSKVRPKDFFKAIHELWLVRGTYLQAPPVAATEHSSAPTSSTAQPASNSSNTSASAKNPVVSRR